MHHVTVTAIAGMAASASPVCGAPRRRNTPGAQWTTTAGRPPRWPSASPAACSPGWRSSRPSPPRPQEAHKSHASRNVRESCAAGSARNGVATGGARRSGQAATRRTPQLPSASRSCGAEQKSERSPSCGCWRVSTAIFWGWRLRRPSAGLSPARARPPSSGSVQCRAALWKIPLWLQMDTPVRARMRVALAFHHTASSLPHPALTNYLALRVHWYCTGRADERAMITRWLQRRATSPMTNQPLRSRSLRPNFALRSEIAAWRENVGNQGSDSQPEVSLPLVPATGDAPVYDDAGDDAGAAPSQLGQRQTALHLETGALGPRHYSKLLELLDKLQQNARLAFLRRLRAYVDDSRAGFPMPPDAYVATPRPAEQVGLLRCVVRLGMALRRGGLSPAQACGVILRLSTEAERMEALRAVLYALRVADDSGWGLLLDSSHCDLTNGHIYAVELRLNRASEGGAGASDGASRVEESEDGRE